MNERDQKEIFLSAEGDNYFRRHRELTAPNGDDRVLDAIKDADIKFSDFLEIGSSNGYRVAHLMRSSGARGAGIDPSNEAIQAGIELYGTGCDLRVGSAETLPFDDNSFDLVIFGFCLYLTDPKDHFRIAAEATRVLRDGGAILIYDFLSSMAFYNDYHHLAGIRSHKMDFSKYFLAHPGFSLSYRKVRAYDAIFPMSDDNSVTVDILRKDMRNAFVSNPFKQP